MDFKKIIIKSKAIVGLISPFSSLNNFLFFLAARTVMLLPMIRGSWQVNRISDQGILIDVAKY